MMIRMRGFQSTVFLLSYLACALPVLAQSPVPPAGAAKPLALTSAVALTSVPKSTPLPPPTQAAAAAPPTKSTIEPKSTVAANDPNTIRVLLSAELETTLAAQMVGRISNLHAQLGKRIQKGKPVLSFDCGEASARLNMAQAEYAAAKETLNVKERLYKLDAAGDMEVNLATANSNKAIAAIAVSRAQLAQCTVVAPFTGHVVKIHVKPHQGVNIGAPLVEMIGDGPLKLRLNVPSRWLRQLKVGTPFDVMINETGRTYPAKISLINARVDAVAQTIELEARMDTVAPDLLAGMSGIARFRIEP